MNETLEDLKIKRNAVNFTFNNLFDTIQEEEHINTTKRLKAKIEALEKELEMWKNQAEFLAHVRSIRIS